MSEIKLLHCPFCGEDIMYKVERVDFLGTVIPQLFCNSCKMIFEIENDSPYLNDKKTEEYLKEKLYKQFNTRKPMERIVERLEGKLSDTNFEKATQECNESYVDGLSMGYAEAIGICKEEGGIE